MDAETRKPGTITFGCGCHAVKSNYLWSLHLCEGHRASATPKPSAFREWEADFVGPRATSAPDTRQRLAGWRGAIDAAIKKTETAYQSRPVEFIRLLETLKEPTDA